MSELTVISGTRRAMREMADGTIEVKIHIDPAHRKAFMENFGQIDMPVAIAPLVADFEQRAPEAEKAKGGPLAKLAGMLCADPNFWEFLNDEFMLPADVTSAEQAARVIRNACRVESRAELDSNAEAESDFHASIRGPWLKWRAANGLK